MTKPRSFRSLNGKKKAFTDPATTATRRLPTLDDRVLELMRRVDQLTQLVVDRSAALDAACALLDQIVPQIAETNLRVLFTMNQLGVKKTSPIASPSGQHAVVAMSMTQFYHEQRETFLQKLQEERQQLVDEAKTPVPETPDLLLKV